MAKAKKRTGSSYVIVLSDGTEINAFLNAGTWETAEEVTEEIFDGKLDNVSYLTPEGDVIDLGECKFGLIGYSDSREVWQFLLTPLTQEEKNANLIRQAISDVSDAILEMSEIVYGEE